MANKFNVTAKQIIQKIEDLISEGNLRRIIIKDQNGDKYIEIPILIGAIGIIAAPFATIIGVIAGYAANFTIEIIRKDNPEVVEVYQLQSHNE